MSAWDMWKKGFDSWEQKTANLLEHVIRSPMVLKPSGALLTAVMKAKTAGDRAKTSIVSAIGLPTRGDQERVLHVLNRLESRLIDLEERLEDQEAANKKKTAANGAHEARN
jgi:hypothetical protein